MDEAINWHDLEILNAVLEQGSFSAAARALGLSQPTVSRHIEGLERKLERELFTRANSGPEPSDLAVALGRHTAQMGDGMFAIRRTLDGEEETPEGIVTLSLPYGLGGIVLARALDGFHQRFPDISIDLKTGPPQSNLGRREADIDLRWREPSEPDVITRSIGSFHIGIFASDNYIKHHGMPRNGADLSDHAFPHVDEGVMSLVLESLTAYGVEPHRFPFRCSGSIMMSTMLGTMGITLCMAPINMEAEGLHRVCPDFRFVSPSMWLTMHSALRRNTRIRVVWDWLGEHLPPALEQTREETAG